MRIGIDLGGTKIEAIALGDDGGALARRRTETPRGDYGATLDAIAELIKAVEAEAGGTGSVGLATPGAISPDSGRIKNSNSEWLIGEPLASGARCASPTMPIASPSRKRSMAPGPEPRACSASFSAPASAAAS